MIKAVKGGFQLHSKTTGKPLGPVRSSKEETYQKDEKRVEFFKNLKKSSGGPGSLAAKVGETNPDLVAKVKGPDLPSTKATKARATKAMKPKGMKGIK